MPGICSQYPVPGDGADRISADPCALQSQVRLPSRERVGSALFSRFSWWFIGENPSEIDIKLGGFFEFT